MKVLAFLGKAHHRQAALDQRAQQRRLRKRIAAHFQQRLLAGVLKHAHAGVFG